LLLLLRALYHACHPINIKWRYLRCFEYRGHDAGRGCHRTREDLLEMVVGPLLGATMGLACVFLANGLRKVPWTAKLYSRSGNIDSYLEPVQHVIGLGVGAGLGYWASSHIQPRLQQ